MTIGYYNICNVSFFHSDNGFLSTSVKFLYVFKELLTKYHTVVPPHSGGEFIWNKFTLFIQSVIMKKVSLLI